MYRLRAEFCKGEEIRYIGHLDILRTLERALRRAELPVARTQGFNPRQKIAFASPLPVGITGERELVDMEFDSEISPDSFLQRINSALPTGMRFSHACGIAIGGPSLMADLDQAEYLARWHETLADGLEPVLELFLQQDEIFILRRSKKGERRLNIRPAVLQLKDGGSRCDDIRLLMCLKLSGEVTAKPNEVLEALREISGLKIEAPLLTRLEVKLSHRK